MRQAIDRLENNFETGDTVVDVIGFSRGAALAVSFANELAGKLPRVSIRFMGLWDVVGQFGAPGRRFNAGHDLGMPPNVMRCYHAMALDETRLVFPLTRLSETDSDNGRLLEVWFRGVHTDVGGGNGNRGLNWISLNWLFENARRDGLPINRTAIMANAADSRLPQQISRARVDAASPPCDPVDGPASHQRPSGAGHRRGGRTTTRAYSACAESTTWGRDRGSGVADRTD